MPPATLPATDKTARLARLRPLALLLAFMALAYGLGLHNYLSIERLADNRQAIEGFVAARPLLAGLSYFVLYTLVVALSLPVASFLTLLGGFAFGPLAGCALTVAAATLGALGLFLIARSSLGDALAARAGPWLEKLRAGFSDHALNYLLFLRLVPLFPFWLVNIAPALLGVPAPVYVLGTLLGIIPATFAMTYVGAGLGSLIDAQTRAQQACVALASERGVALDCPLSLHPANLVTAELLIALAALGGVALIPIVVRKLKRR